MAEKINPTSIHDTNSNYTEFTKFQEFRIIDFHGYPMVVPIRNNKPDFSEFPLEQRDDVRKAWIEDWRIRYKIRYDEIYQIELLEYEKIYKNK